MWGELLVRDSPVSPHPWGRIRVRQPRLRAAPWARGRRALLDTRGQPRCSTVALPAGVSQAGWITRCPCRCPARGLGEQAGPNLRAPSRDPTRIWRCRSLVPPALCPGEASAPRACATAGVGRDLELWPPNTTARSLLGSPSVASGWAGRELHPKFRGVPPSWPCFPRLGGLGAGGGGGCQPGPLDTGPRQQLPSTGGCHSAAEQPGTGTPNPCLTPVCPPAPRWHGSGSGLVALGATLRWRQGQRRGRCRSGAGVWRGGSLRRGVGAPGAAGAPGLGRARQPCVTAAPQTRPT